MALDADARRRFIETVGLNSRSALMGRSPI
jgi:hypothetical protein